MTRTSCQTPEDEVIELIPRMRAYARALTRNSESADDLVQETLVKALAKIDSFQPGTTDASVAFHDNAQHLLYK